MKTLSVTKSDIANANYRFDASYHLSDGVSIRRRIKHSPLGETKICDITERIFYGIRANRVYVSKPEHAIPFMTGANIMLANLDNTKLVSRIHTPGIKEMTLKPGWVMITRSGTVGQTAWSNKIHEGKYGSEDIIRVVPNSKIKGGLLYAFFASKYGQSLLTQGSFGAVIQHIEPSFIGEIKMPVFEKGFENEVNNLIEQAARLREESTDALNTAVEVFENNIGSSNFNFDHQSAAISSKNIAARFVRFDAQYQIGNKRLLKEKENLKTIKIESLSTKILVGNRGKREYVEKNGVPFLSSSDMMLANPLRGCKQIRKNSNNIENMLVSKGDILISRSGTVGNTVIVGDTLNQVAVSEHAMKLSIDSSKIAPEYVFAYFKTKQGQNSLQILPYGSVIITLGEEFLGNVDLPIIPKEDMDNVVELIKEYVYKNDKAIELENQAISMVEQEIEKWNN
ncbi:restriction endonuclease subunit S [Prevotella sp. P5-64]|uniref:methylation-associated defense system restriction endonuclease subunit S MAD5 n=1 Tax=Prevotella sp. P5-64 TaxID=2024226 RepID=UPI000B969D4B|nr:restriction endonuclease subunit S [Prevotella sp. P5-64]OYP68713.1 hypothetical protein CIK87_06850 [Prevotella sp. P5-64]